MRLLPERTHPFLAFLTTTTIEYGPFYACSEHITKLLLTLLLLVLLHAFLFRTRLGLALKSVSDNP